MSRSVVQIYAAAVCFVSVGCLAIALGITIYSAVGVINPAFTLHPMSVAPYPLSPWELSSISPNGTQVAGLTENGRIAPLSEEEVAKRQAAAFETAKRNELATAKQSLLRWSIVALLSGILFFVHWRILHDANGRDA